MSLLPQWDYYCCPNTTVINRQMVTTIAPKALDFGVTITGKVPPATQAIKTPPLILQNFSSSIKICQSLALRRSVISIAKQAV